MSSSSCDGVQKLSFMMVQYVIVTYFLVIFRRYRIQSRPIQFMKMLLQAKGLQWFLYKLNSMSFISLDMLYMEYICL